MPPPSTSRSVLLSTILLLSLASLPTALQFDLEAGGKHCFYEDIPAGTSVVVSYLVVEGDGELPVTLQVTHAGSSGMIYARDRVDFGKFSFMTPTRAGPARDPQALPRAAPDWHVRDVAGAGPANQEPALARANAGARAAARELGSGPVPASDARRMGSAAQGPDAYAFCFGKSLSDGSGLMHLFPRGRGEERKRRVVFEVKTGADAMSPEELGHVAKEMHLLESDKLFVHVNEYATEVARRVLEMREWGEEMERMHANTSSVVVMYSVMSCCCILLSAGAAMYATQNALRKRKAI